MPICLTKMCCWLLLIFTLNMSSVSAYAYDFELLNENDGFASSIIFSIVQDKSGFIWFGTAYNGVMRYDGKNILRYQHEPGVQNSLGHNNAGNLSLDNDDNLWIGSWGGGVLRYNQQSQKFSQYKAEEGLSNSISSNKVQNIFQDQQGLVWLGTNAHGLNRFNPDSQDFSRFPLSSPTPKNLSIERVWDIAETDAHSLWIGGNYGLTLFDKVTSTFSHFVPMPDKVTSKHNRVRRITAGEDDKLFLGTQDGVLLFEPDSQRFTALETGDKLSVGSVYSMIKTDFNQYWLSSDRGVFSFSADNLTLKKVPLGFDDSCSQTLFQDRQGIIWLSCEGVGVYKITKTQTFKNFEKQSVKAAYALLVANDGSVLIGTAQNGIHKWIPDTNQLTRLDLGSDSKIQPEIRYITQTSKGDIWYANGQSLFVLDKAGIKQQIYPRADNKGLFLQIYAIAKDKQDDIWLATDTGVYIVDAENWDFEAIAMDEQGSLVSGEIIPFHLYLDPSERMWVATNKGLMLWNKKTKNMQSFSFPDDYVKGGEVKKRIYFTYQDSQQRFWVSTKIGLYLFNEDTTEYTLYNQYFLESNNRGVRFINEDKQGNLWLVTPIGISKLNPKNGFLQHFDHRDGLPDSRYFYSPTASTTDGTLYLPTREGIYYFDPQVVTDHAMDEQTRLTNFEVLGSAKRYNIAAVEAAGLVLNHKQNNIKFEFATLDFLNARKIQYSYKLDGFDTDWIENGKQNTATFTNLAGGDYTFRVRAAIKDNLWYRDELAIKLTIETILWKRWWMFVLYGCLVLLGIYYYTQRQKRSVLKLERQVAEKTASIALESSKLASANKVKTQFLANMSHEIRTPLTTIIGQAEAIICKEVDPKDIYAEVEVIHDSGLYLLSLLNDILDVTKIEENKFELEPVPQDLHSLLRNINTMFSLQAKVKGLSFSLSDNLPLPFIVNVDGLRLKQILINLCSNALKFTLEGQVFLSINAEEGQLIFKLEDTGIGISDSQLKQIFASFTQGDNSIRRRFGGSGLGLHLSNQLAKLMGGTITVQSKIDQGSVFTFSLPLSTIALDTELVQNKASINISSSEQLFNGKILLAEDHADNRRLIARILTKLGLTVFAAKDGFEAIELYLQHQPKLILLDIQMPNMDGLQAYQSLRDLGCTLPIIALTANAMLDEVEQYLGLGFDGYLKKPLDRQLLIGTITEYFDSKVDKAEQQANKALDRVDMSDLVLEFKQGLVSEQQQFIVHCAKENLQSLTKQAHRLCGAAQLFGFAALSQKAARLEISIKNEPNDLPSIKALVGSLLDEIETILAD